MSDRVIFMLGTLLLLLIVPGCTSERADYADTAEQPDASMELALRLRDAGAALVVTVDDMVCSSCVNDLVDGINASCEDKIIVVASAGNDVMVKKWLSRSDIPVWAESSRVLQQTFPSNYSLTISEWRDGAFRQIADVNTSNSVEYGKLLAQWGCYQ